MFMPLYAAAIAVSQAAPGAVLIDRNRIDRAPAPVEQPARPATAPSPRIEIGKPGAPISGIVFEGAQAPAPVAEAARKIPRQADHAQDAGRTRRRVVGGV